MTTIRRSDGTNPLCSCGAAIKKDYTPPVFAYLDFCVSRSRCWRSMRTRCAGGLADGEIRGKTLLASLCAYWRQHALRRREGVAPSFGPVFIVLLFVLLLAGAKFLYDAETHPPTANAAQVLIGSVCVVFSVLLIFFLIRKVR